MTVSYESDMCRSCDSDYRLPITIYPFNMARSQSQMRSFQAMQCFIVSNNIFDLARQELTDYKKIIHCYKMAF